MARSPRFYRTECELNRFGQVMVEIKGEGIRIVSRETPGLVWSWTWDYLAKLAEQEAQGKGPSPVSAEMR